MTDLLLFIAAAVLAGLLIGRSRPGFIWIVAAILVAVAGAAFAQVPWLGGFASSALGFVFGLFGSVDAAAKFVLIALALIVVLDVIVDKKLDKRGATALFLMPTIALLTSGALAAAIVSGYGALSSGIVSAISSI